MQLTSQFHASILVPVLAGLKNILLYAALWSLLWGPLGLRVSRQKDQKTSAFAASAHARQAARP